MKSHTQHILNQCTLNRNKQRGTTKHRDES